MKNIVSIVLSITLLLIGGCGSDNNTQSSEKKLQKVSIMLDWYPNAVHSSIYVALDKGFFEKHGLDVEIKMPADTNDPLKLVAAGKVDIGLSYQPQVLIARGENIPVKSIGAFVREPLNTIMVAADGKIKSPKDLTGKTIGYPSIPLNDAMINTMVKTDNGDPTKVKLVDVGWNLIPTLATKKTDAIAGGFINHELLLLEKEGHAVKIFKPTEYGVPNYYELVLVTSEKSIDQNSETLKSFIKALTEGQEYVVKNPKEGLSVLLVHENKTSPLDKGIEKKSLEILLPLMDAKDKPFLYQDENSWERVGAWLLEHGILKVKVDSKNAFVNF
ncbi:MAG: hypothetical protein K0S51_2267 [Bacillales bacterium]|jgi:putative hydroxymethylpyrimidine transport system substrate-binding protein|nr:hypothetical protein [Bacillales bacterium]